MNRTAAVTRKNDTLKRSLRERIFQYRYMYLFLLPAIVWYVIFAYGPIYGLQIAFKDFKIAKGIAGSQWVGLALFEKMFKDATFWHATFNTIFISALKLIFVAPSGLVLAIGLNEVFNKRYKGLVSSITMLPHFFSWVIISSILVQILSPSSGMVNAIIQFFGGQPVYFLGRSDWFMFWVVASDVWESAGWNSIIFLAAIGGIAPDLYEAAQLDGAGRWKQLTRITIPCIAGTIVVVMILKVGSMMNAGFDQVFNLYNDAVMSKADILDTYVYRLGIKSGKFSYSTAVGLFKNVINLALVLLTNLAAKKMGQEGLF